MATYTILLKRLIDSGYQLTLDEYPIFDEAYRATLNKKILDHYAFVEIGFETPAMFNHQLKIKMNEIMPLYNDLYKAKAQTFKIFDPYTYDEWVEYLGKTINTGQDSGTDSTTHGNTFTAGQRDGTSKQFNFDTPQNIASLNDGQENHMSSASKTTSTQQTYTDTNNGTDMTTYGKTRTDTLAFEDRKDHRYGYNQSKYKTFDEFQKALINIDEMIIDELLDLFMLVY